MTPKEILQKNNGSLVVLENGERYIYIFGELTDGTIHFPLSTFDKNLCSNTKTDVKEIYYPLVSDVLDSLTLVTDGRRIAWKRPNTKEVQESFSHRTFRKAIEKYGLKNQMTKTVEELSELSQALCKAIIRLDDPEKVSEITCADLDSIDNIFEEMADVEIMLSQCRMMFRCDTEVNEWIDKKIQRLSEKLNNE